MKFKKGIIPWNKGIKCPWTVKLNKSRKGMPNLKKRTRKKVLCEMCLKEIIRIPSTIMKHVFCSQACTFKWRKTEEFRKEQSVRTSQSQRLVWEIKSYKEKMKKLRIEIWNRPEFKKKRSLISKSFWKNSKRRELASKRMSGKNHPNWQGGKSYESYGGGFTPRLREMIRFRDGYKCKKCGCPQLENGRTLDVHHKDRNKKNNDMKNLITLCQSCHVSIHWSIRKKEKKLCV